MKKAIKKHQNKVNSFKRARDEIINYIDKRIEKQTRTLRKFGNRITRGKD
jgi:hypothetical protein